MLDPYLERDVYKNLSSYVGLLEKIFKSSPLQEMLRSNIATYDEVFNRDFYYYQYFVFLGKFLILLSQADGKTSSDEIEFIDVAINRLKGTLSGTVCYDYIMKMDFSKKNDEPLTFSSGFFSPKESGFSIEIDFNEDFKLLDDVANYDNIAFIAGDGDLCNEASSLFLMIFSNFGRQLISIDGDIDIREVEYLTKVIDTIRSILLSKLKIKKLDFSSCDLKNGKVAPHNRQSSLEDLLAELNSLIGLSEVKVEIASLVNLIKIKSLREQRGMKQPNLSFHLVFSGNPGTGKTTIARLITDIYYELGLIKEQKLIEVDRSGLVGGYVGQTAIKTSDVIKSALGGVLFIDEAYSLAAAGSDNDYGLEATDTIVKGMEDNRENLIVIVAGYPNLMCSFLSSNPGLKSRFNRFISFLDYSAKELHQIFTHMANKSGMKIDGHASALAQLFFEKILEKNSLNFANARGVRNLFEKAIIYQADRLADCHNISNDKLALLEGNDIKSSIIDCVKNIQKF